MSEPERWISTSEASRILAVDRTVVTKLAYQGRFAVRRLADGPPRYRLSDVLAFAERSITPKAPTQELQPG